MKWFREMIKEKHSSEYKTLQGKKVYREWTFEEAFNNNNEIKFNFDSKGRLIQFYNDRGAKETNLKFDENDNLIEFSEYIDERSFDTFSTHKKHTYSYDSNGNLKLYFTGENISDSKLIVKQSYNKRLLISQEISTPYHTDILNYKYENGRLNSIEYNFKSKDKEEKNKLLFMYNDEKKEVNIEATSGWREIRRFNDKDKIIYRHTLLKGTTIQKVEYSYDQFGNLTRKINENKYTIEHCYDSNKKRVMTVINYPTKKIQYSYEYKGNSISVKESKYSSSSFIVDETGSIVYKDWDETDKTYYCKEGIISPGGYGDLYFTNKSRIKIYDPRYDDKTLFPIPLIATVRNNYLIDDHDLNKVFAIDESDSFYSKSDFGLLKFESILDEVDWREPASEENISSTTNSDNDYYIESKSHWDEYDEDGIPYSDYKS